MLLLILGCGDDGGGPGEILVFEDEFNVNLGWVIFEEIVGGSPCYGSGLGEGALDSSRYRVWANKALSLQSNHVIGGNRISSSGETGIWRYELSAYIDPATAATGQTGPEFSMQNTREIAPGATRTIISGIQYRSNPFISPFGTWAVWVEQSPGVAFWEVFMTQPISPGAWYYFSLEVDYTENQYVRMIIRCEGLDLSIDLSA